MSTPCSNFYLDDTPCLNPAVLREEAERQGLPISHWWGKANSYTQVRGRSHNFGWLLMTWGQAKAFDASTTHTIKISSGPYYHNQPFSIYNVYILRRSLLYTSSDAASDETACLVYVGDARYAWSLAQFHYSYTYPHKAPLNCPHFPTEYSQAVPSNYWFCLPSSGTYSSGAPSVYQGGSGNNDPGGLSGSLHSALPGMSMLGTSAWDLYCNWIEAHNHIYVHSQALSSGGNWGMTGDFSYEYYLPWFGTPIHSSMEPYLVENDCAETAPLHSYIPYAYKVYFPSSRHVQQDWTHNPRYPVNEITHGVSYGGIPWLAYKVSGGVEPYCVEVLSGITDGLPHSVKMPIWDKYIARYEKDGTMSQQNKAALKDRAEWVALSTTRRLLNFDCTRTLYGLFSFGLNGIFATIKFFDYGNGVHTTFSTNDTQSPEPDTRFKNLGAGGAFPYRNGESMYFLSRDMAVSFYAVTAEELEGYFYYVGILVSPGDVSTSAGQIRAWFSDSLIRLILDNPDCLTYYTIPQETRMLIQWSPSRARFEIISCPHLVKRFIDHYKNPQEDPEEPEE